MSQPVAAGGVFHAFLPRGAVTITTRVLQGATRSVGDSVAMKLAGIDRV